MLETLGASRETPSRSWLVVLGAYTRTWVAVRTIPLSQRYLAAMKYACAPWRSRSTLGFPPVPYMPLPHRYLKGSAR